MIDMPKEWLKASYIDLRNIEHIIDDEYLTGVVSFHSQQAIEKSFKALIVYKDIKVPKQHDLLKLSHILSNELQVDEDTLDTLNELYIDSRYPSEMGLLPNGKPTLEEAREFYNFAREIFEKICSIINVDISKIITT